MKKKKNIVFVVVGLVVVLGVVVSRYVNWPVDNDNVSGDVAKSVRFNRQTAQEAASNMQELLLNDEDYKKTVVLSYMVMKTRAEQFNALVDMSVQMAANIKEYDDVLKEMKDAQNMVNNVCVAMETAGKDLNAALGGEVPVDLAQNTSNAALAYNTLQKQSSLANRFVDTTDEYLKNSIGDDRLKLVRDQWVEYQQLTAVLDKDDVAAKEMVKKDYLLNSEKAVAALGAFSESNQLAATCSSALSEALGLKMNLRASEIMQNDMLGVSATLRNSLGLALKSIASESSSLSNTPNSALNNNPNAALNNSFNSALKSASNVVVLQAMSSLPNLVGMETKLNNFDKVWDTDWNAISHSVNDVINSIAVGEVSNLNFNLNVQ